VSLPQFNPNLFVNGISHADYNRLTKNLSVPLFDRNLHGGTPPGSTIKPFMGLAGLELGLRRPSDRILSTGEWRINGRGRAFGDAHRGGHGWVDLKESIAQSVNTYYYQLAMDMGVERFDDIMAKYGFGKATGIDLIGETDGILPSPEYKRKRWKQDWYMGDLVNAGIGQGLWKATLLQLAQATAALADDGQRHRLHLLRSTRKGFDAPWLREPQPAPAVLSTSHEHMQSIRDAMVATVHGPTGTARAIGLNSPYLMGGKTGTAQVVSNKNNLRLDPHSLPLNLRHQALFIAFAPAEAPRIAVAVIVEHGGFGASSAAPIARAIMDAYLLPKASQSALPLAAPGAPGTTPAASAAAGTPPAAHAPPASSPPAPPATTPAAPVAPVEAPPTPDDRQFD
jgi:penicillin-binding protein 2